MENSILENSFTGDAGAVNTDMYSGRVKTVKEASYPSIDKGTIRRLRDGDHHAFEKVFHAFYGRVKSFLRVVMKSEDMADELSQKVFVNLWVYRKNINPERNFNAYVYTMARNAAMTALKSQFKDDYNVFEQKDESCDQAADENIIARETELLVKMTVSRMPPKRKQVYQLSRFECKSNDEIARELNISRKVVEKHLRLALHEIREAIRVMTVFF